VFGECGYYVGHCFQAKTITYSSCSFITWWYDTYGILLEVGWVPDLILTMFSIPMSYLERMYNTLLPFYWSYSRNCNLSPMLQKVVKLLFPNEEVEGLPFLYELENKLSMVLINSVMDIARTLSPLFVDIGGWLAGGRLVID